jgi:hypothetical protein
MPAEHEPTPPHHLTGCQLADYLTAFYVRNRDRLAAEEREVLWEVVCRVEEHERLVRDVLPDLRNRITQLEEALPRLLPPGEATALLLDGLRPARENAPSPEPPATGRRLSADREQPAGAG